MVDDLSGILTLADYEARAQNLVPAASWAHLQEGSGEGRTLRRNREAFDRWGLLPTAMADLRCGSSAVTLLGRRHAAPILLAPIAYQTLAHPDGEVAVAHAAAALETGMILSTLSGVGMEEVASVARSTADVVGGNGAPLWFQLYFQPRREHSLALVRRAEQAGYEAIVLTIDAAIKRSSFVLPEGVEAENLAGFPRPRHVTTAAGGPILFGTPLADAAPRWEDLAWLRGATELPILLKGMIVGDDVGRAIDMGVDGLILSNHGGRILDILPSAIEMLPDVLRLVGGKVPVLVDGGIRTGADVAIALALGADAVLVGRPQLHALAVGGVAGVMHMLHILRTELEMVMAQLGCPSVAALRQDRLVRL